MNQPIEGARVTGRYGHFLRVEAPSAPEHLRVLYLTPLQAPRSEVGTVGRLVWCQSASCGFWLFERK